MKKFQKMNIVRTLIVFLLVLMAITDLSAKEKIQNTKPHYNIGIIGHTGHSKSTLASAITKVLSTKDYAKYIPPQELSNPSDTLERGVKMKIANIDFETDDRSYTLSYFPRHSDYMKSMITGAVQMDGAILVVSAPDGPMPQTREHILLARQVGVPYIVVALNKVDMMDDEELLDLVELEVRDLLSQYGFPGDDIPVVRVNALKALKGNKEAQKQVLQLISKLDDYIPEPVRDMDKPFLMAIEDVFTISGRGTVVTGRVERGKIAGGDEVEIVGFGETQKTVATSLEMFKVLDDAVAGDNVGVLLRGTGKDEIERGQVLAKPGSITPHKKFKAEVYVLKKEEGGKHTPFFSGYRPQFYLRTTDVTGSIVLPEGVEMVMPGDNINMDVELIAPVAMQEQLRFAIREGGRTVGVGVVTKIVE